MSYPFPGMNPWLENHRLWKDVHARLITAIGDSLADALEPRYFVGVETHTYISASPPTPPSNRYPDVTIMSMGGAAVAIKPNPATDIAVPLLIDLPISDNVEEPYLEIRLVPSGEVVTVIELLSHTNKQGGRDRESYLQKRRTFLDANVNFVEIDLLRSHMPMPFTEEAEGAHYRIFSRRRETRHKALLYAFMVKDSIPAFPIPLQPDDEEPSLDLGALLQEVYNRARYHLILDYNKPPVPELNNKEMVWFKERLSEAN